MPVKRRSSKTRPHRITQDALDAFQAGDYAGLHHALGLKPWEISPLPLSVSPLGCDQGPYPFVGTGSCSEATWEQAQRLQSQILSELD